MKRIVKKYYTPVAIREMTCQLCGKMFLSKNKRKYCGKTCQNKANYKPTIGIMIKKCPICGCVFERLSGCNAKGTRTKYCSDKCRKSYEHRPKYNRWCVVCGKYFMAKYIKSKTCSNECCRQFNFGSKIEKTCPVCGQARIVYQTKRHIDKPNNGICCERCKNIRTRRDQRSKDSQAVNDRYVKDTLRRYKKTITPETIELKRQQIIMIRTLKQFKQWRKENENESNYTDVYGKQRADEENHEGRISA